MIRKIFLFSCGSLMCAYSLMLIIVYVNLIDMGYSFLEYLKFISVKIECLLLILGIIFIYLSLRKEKK